MVSVIEALHEVACQALYQRGAKPYCFFLTPGLRKRLHKEAPMSFPVKPGDVIEKVRGVTIETGPENCLISTGNNQVFITRFMLDESGNVIAVETYP